MAGTQTRIQVATDAGFQRRVEALLVSAAIGVLKQSAPDATLVALAKQIINRQVNIEVMCYVLLADSAVDAAGLGASDAELTAAMNANVAALAKVAV